MSAKYLIDTDVLLDLINGEELAIEFLDSVMRADEVVISTVTFAEVYAGIHASNDPDRTRARIEHFFSISEFELVPLTGEPAKRAGLLYGTLAAQGLRTGMADLPNAAIAVEYGYTVVTRNIRHYNRVPTLKIVSPSVS